MPLVTADRSRPDELSDATEGRDFALVVDCAGFQQPDIDAAVAAFSGHVGLYVFISTDLVYAPASDMRFPVTEEAAKQHDVPYAIGKLACETALLRAWETQRFPCAILRPPHILGAGRPLGCDPLAFREPQLLDQMRAGQELSLLMEGTLLIQPVWNREIGSCITHLAAEERPDRLGGQIFNVAGPDAVTTRRYYEIIAERLGVPLRFRSVSREEFLTQSPDGAQMARHRLYDLRRLAAATGYQPQYRLEDALQETAQWLDGPGRQRREGG